MSSSTVAISENEAPDSLEKALVMLSHFDAELKLIIAGRS